MYTFHLTPFRKAWLIALLLSFVLYHSAPAQENPEAEKLKKVIDKILNLCRNESDKQLAGFICYRLDDPARKWKDAYDPAQPEELAQVRKLRREIQENYLVYKNYKFIKYLESEESEGKWQVWQIKFYDSAEESKEAYFAFLKIKEGFILGDID